MVSLLFFLSVFFFFFFWVQQLTRDVSDHPSAEYLAAKLSGGGGRREGEGGGKGEVRVGGFVYGGGGISLCISQHSEIWHLFNSDVTVPSAHYSCLEIERERRSNLEELLSH